MLDTEVREYIRKECKILAKDCEDISDAKEYVGELVTDTLMQYPSAPIEEIRETANSILSELFNEDS